MSRRGPGRTRRPPRDAATPTPRAAATARARPFPAGRTPSPPGWNGAPPRGPRCWTRCAPAPPDSASTVTAAQVGRVHRRLAAAGLLAGRPAAVFVFDSGYDLTRIAYLTSHDGVPVQVLGRVRSDRVFYGPAPGAPTTARAGLRGGTGRVSPWPSPPACPSRPAGRGRQRPLRAGAGQRLARTAPAAVPRRGLERARRRTAHRPRHRDPPSSRPPARQPHPQRPVAMAPRPARYPLRPGPAVEDLPAALRAHLPADQGHAGLDHAADTTRPPRPRHPVGKKNAAPTRKKRRSGKKPADDSTAGKKPADDSTATVK